MPETSPIGWARLLPLAALVWASGCAPGGGESVTDPHARRANELARQLLIVDTHIDVPYRLRSSSTRVRPSPTSPAPCPR